MPDYGTPETDKMMNDLMQKVIEYDKNKDYYNAKITLGKIITSLELLEKEQKLSGNVAVIRSEVRDRVMYIKILEIKEKQVEMENRMDNFAFKIQKLDEIINDKSEGK